MVSENFIKFSYTKKDWNNKFKKNVISINEKYFSFQVPIELINSRLMAEFGSVIEFGSIMGGLGQNMAWPSASLFNVKIFFKFQP